jgi:hypothetical protein
LRISKENITSSAVILDVKLNSGRLTAGLNVGGFFTAF